MKKCIQVLTCVMFISALLLCVILMQGRADVVFQDNFQSGNLNNWTVLGIANIVTAPVAPGYTYSVQIPLSSNASYIKAPFPPLGSETFEFYFMTDTLSNGNAGIPFATIVNGYTMFVFMLVSDANGTLDWVLGYPQTVYEPGTSIQSIPSTIQANTWYKFDLAVENSGGNGAFQFSINDSPIYSLSSIKFDWNPTYFILGLAAGATGYNSGNIYFDGVTITNSANIPVSTPTPSPTASPLPTATLNASPTSTPESGSNIPEMSWLVILPLLFSFLSVAVIVRCRKAKHG